MSRPGRIAVALLAALAAPAARAQWRSDPMVVWLETPGQDVVAGTFASSPGGDDLLAIDQLFRSARDRLHGALLSPVPSAFPIASLPLERAFRAGYLAPGGTDPLADVASHYATGGAAPASRIDVVFGNDPATVRSFALGGPTDAGGPSQGGPPYVVSFLRLLARNPRADTLVLPYCLDDVCSKLLVVDPASATSASVLSLVAPDLEPMDTQPEAFPAWLSTTARAVGLDDVAVGSFGTVVLWEHRSAVTGAPTLADLDLSAPVVVGTTTHFGPLPAWLPPTVPRFNEVHGAATLDVDLDGLPDLVFTMANPELALAGSLVWVKGTGDLADFADPTRATWHDLGAQLGLVDPVTVRPLRGSPPALAVWDRTLQEVLVVRPDLVNGGLAIWRAPAPGAFAKDIRLANVAGSPAQDLVVVMDDGAQPSAVLVYPDDVFPGPLLQWAPGSPGAPVRGVPHPMAVVLDPAGAATVAVDWISGAVTTAPVGAGLAHLFPPDCSVPPPPLVVTARGTDPTGVFTELHATLPLSALPLALALVGAPSAGRLVLPPGGTTAVVLGTAATGCGAASFGGSSWPAAAGVTDTPGPTWLRRTVVLPEAAYPALLADPAFVVSLGTTDPGASPSTVTLPLEVDASGLVAVDQSADRSTLAPGDVAVLRTRLRSRVGVALPSVRVVAALSGLEPAGPAVVSGAAVVSSAAGGADLVLDALPAAGAEVTIALPVRALGGRGASAAEARSQGGWLLTGAARASALAGPAPGCGCGSGSGPGGLALAALGAVLLRRRRGASRAAPPT